MKNQPFSPQESVAEVFGHVSETGYLTKRERQQIQLAILTDSLTEEDRNALDRLLYGLRRGWLRLAA